MRKPRPKPDREPSQVLDIKTVQCPQCGVTHDSTWFKITRLCDTCRADRYA